jgi:hypothetical protein
MCRIIDEGVVHCTQYTTRSRRRMEREGLQGKGRKNECENGVWDGWVDVMIFGVFGRDAEWMRMMGMGGLVE